MREPLFPMIASISFPAQPLPLLHPRPSPLNCQTCQFHRCPASKPRSPVPLPLLLVRSARSRSSPLRDLHSSPRLLLASTAIVQSVPSFPSTSFSIPTCSCSTVSCSAWRCLSNLVSTPLHLHSLRGPKLNCSCAFFVVFSASSDTRTPGPTRSSRSSRMDSTR